MHDFELFGKKVHPKECMERITPDKAAPEAKPVACKMGRPRSFCEVKALDAAMRVFWEKGYEGASLTDLTAAMGINRPSLYAAFGDKQELFVSAVDRYVEGYGSYINSALELPAVRDVVEVLLYESVNKMSDPETPKGCMLVRGELTGSEENAALQDMMTSIRLQTEALIAKRLKRAKAEGDLPGNMSSEDTARYLMTVINGLSVQSANGASKKEMMRVAEMALQALPLTD